MHQAAFAFAALGVADKTLLALLPDLALLTRTVCVRLASVALLSVVSRAYSSSITGSPRNHFSATSSAEASENNMPPRDLNLS